MHERGITIMGISTEFIRNVALLGHGGDGKTTLTEAILYRLGATDRFGHVEDGNTVSDYDPEEIKRRISISSTVEPVEYKGYKINLLDCPGYFDFAGEVTGALSAADAAVIVMSGVSGLVVGTEKAMALTKKLGIPKMIFINQLDRENADFCKVLSQLEAKYLTSVAPVQYPICSNGTLIGYVDVIANKGYKYDGDKNTVIDIPAGLTAQVEDARNRIIEAAAENDEELLEKYFGGEELTVEEIIRGLLIGIRSGATVPVMCGSALEQKGVYSLLDNILYFFPSCKDKMHISADGDAERACNENEPFSAFVFKTISDPFVGKLSFFKVMSGKLDSSVALYNANVGKPEKTGAMYIIRGKKQIPVNEIVAGDIGAMSKLQFTLTNHTLCSESAPIVYPAPEYPKPSITMSVYPKVQGEEDKVFNGLRRLEEEDPTFRLTKNEGTNEMQVSGLGEIHLDVISKKLKSKFNAEVNIVNPKIPYRETIRKAVKAEGKHKKQSGGHGQYGHCWIEFEPLYDSDKNFEFVDKVVGGAVPRNFIPAVEKGLQDCIKKGVLAGYPMVNLRATLYDGSYHDVDSSEMAFKVAASLAYKKGCREANPVLLEPIYTVTVTVPDDYMGDIIGDINKRRGRILGMNPVAEGQQIIAEAPLAEMFKYSTDLRSMTQARGSFEMEFVRYEECPPNIAQKIIESSTVDKDAEE
ncbi:MAG: elongation factor G [Firmicutes bacterium]|nr:elongation factor G [Bacillota bacterium]